MPEPSVTALRGYTVPAKKIQSFFFNWLNIYRVSTVHSSDLTTLKRKRPTDLTEEDFQNQRSNVIQYRLPLKVATSPLIFVIIARLCRDVAMAN